MSTPDPLECFALRAWARAILVREGLMDFHPAIDGLQRWAEDVGLVDEHGQDRIQQIIADEFAVTT
jgi:hypothetical protein